MLTGLHLKLLKMNKKHIVITGANGFIGRYLTEKLATEGHKITALIHSSLKAAWPNVDYRQFDLSSFSKDIIPFGADIVIHLAYIKSENNNSSHLNFESTKRLIAICDERKVGQIIYFSSFSARADAQSQYGRSKFECEKLFSSNHLIISPGLVIGYGGLFKSIDGYLRHNPVVPLIGGGNQPLQFVSIEDVYKVISFSIENSLNGKLLIAHEKYVSMRDFYSAVSIMRGKKMFFIGIPYLLADFAFNVFDKLFKTKGISKENYLGLKAMKILEVDDLNAKFGIITKDLTQSLEMIKLYEENCNHDHH